jgi:predicted secreted protein
MRFLGALAAVLALAACGSAGLHAANPPPPAGSPLPQGSVIANADDGKIFALRVGDEVEVALRQEPGFAPWQNVTSTDTMVLQPTVDTHAASVVGMSLHKFRAAATGQAQIQATTTVMCSPGTACPALARTWHVTISVS